MPLRVIAGSARGRRLRPVPGDSTRPVMDRVKEACFSILGARVAGARFLDLFAGTGSVGIEALSRGARQTVFVERDRRAIETIHANLLLTNLADRAVVQRNEVFAFLRRPPGEPFDIIYIAPPQYQGLWKRTLEALDANPGWLDAGTIIIVQIDPSEAEDALTLQHLVEHDRRRYGNTLLWFFDAQVG